MAADKMKEKLFNKLGWICLIIFSVLAAIYMVTIYVFKFDSDQISVLTNLFLAFATFTAACTAVLFFTDWREQHDKSISNKFAWKVIDSFDLFNISFMNFLKSLEDLEKKIGNPQSFSEELKNLDREALILLIETKSMKFNLANFRESLRKYSVYSNKEDWYKGQEEKIYDLFLNLNLDHLEKNDSKNIISGIKSSLDKITPQIYYFEHEVIDKLINELKSKT
ncbi:hypothetical protein [Acinetobacter sp. ANC 5502]